MAAAVFAGVVLGSAEDVNAQTRRQIERERQRVERQNERLQRQRERNARSLGYYEDDHVRGSARAGANNAVSMGYQQGLLAGQHDRRDRKYNRFNVYRNTGSAPNSGDPTSYDYLYRQGYLAGYEDGYRGRVRY